MLFDPTQLWVPGQPLVTQTRLNLVVSFFLKQKISFVQRQNNPKINSVWGEPPYNSVLCEWVSVCVV